eukprot:652637-Amphidinium_carterae.1
MGVCETPAQWHETSKRWRIRTFEHLIGVPAARLATEDYVCPLGTPVCVRAYVPVPACWLRSSP